MEIPSQKHLFQLPEDIHYLNCAYMSPLLKSVELAGIAGIQRKRNPSALSSEDFFLESEQVKARFGQLVNGNPDQVALIPSASYGLQSALANIPGSKHHHAITVEDEFPSGVYALREWGRQHEAEVITIARPGDAPNQGLVWTQRILEAINPQTAVVLLSSVHWTDGVLFNLEQIGRRCKEVGALLVVDGTQSVGAMPIDIVKDQIDVLVCAAYKWMMGPYSTGLAYYSTRFNDGRPMENSWMTRANAHDFTRLIQYTEAYAPGARRYDVGEFSNFILTPMLYTALGQLLDWGPERIQSYAKKLSEPLIEYLNENGYRLETPEWRSGHLFGIGVPGYLDTRKLLEALKARKIYLSLRGQALRVSVNVFNDENDIEALIQALQ